MQNVRAFQLADGRAILTCRETRKFPKDELYGLASPMRRAAVSVPSNIVEGCARESQVEFLLFLEMAFGSLRELRYQFGLSKRLGYLDEHSFAGYDANFLAAEKVLGALIRSLRSSSRTLSGG
ncbi:MAG: four helix bundle protein [Thermodesulfobacteriota bacterium]